jgi:hypothetical protein
MPSTKKRFPPYISSPKKNNKFAQSEQDYTKETLHMIVIQLLIIYKYKKNDKLIKTAIDSLLKNLTEKGMNIEEEIKDLPDEFKPPKSKSKSKTLMKNNSMTLFSEADWSELGIDPLEMEKGQSGGKRNHKKNKRTQKRK